jgi:hypothetical protein
MLGLRLLGRNPDKLTTLYDGSWSEYGSIAEPNFEEIWLSL